MRIMVGVSFLAVLMLSACGKQEPVEEPVEVPVTVHEALASGDQKGVDVIGYIYGSIPPSASQPLYLCDTFTEWGKCAKPRLQVVGVGDLSLEQVRDLIPDVNLSVEGSTVQASWPISFCGDLAAKTLTAKDC